MAQKNRILIVDDDQNLLRSLSDVLRLNGFEVLTAEDGKSAIKTVETDPIDIALIDLNLADIPGLEVLSEIERISPDTECMLLTGFASQETAIEAVNRGAFAYFQKPYDIDMLILAIRRAIEKRQSEIALRLSEERHQMVAALTSDYVYELVVDEHGKTDRGWISESFTRITGYTPEEMDERGGWLSLFHPDDTDIYSKQVESLKSNHPDFSEFRIIRKDGEVRWIEDYSRPIYDQKLGRVIKIIGAARDVTEKKQGQLELKVSETRHQMVSELTSDYVYEMEVDEQGGFHRLWISGSFMRITGYSPEEMDALGGWVSLVHPNDTDIYARQIAHLLDDRPDFSEYRIVRKDGEVRWVEDFSRPIKDESSGRIVKIFGAKRDITEKKGAQAQIQAQAEKLKGIYEAAPIGIGINANRIIIEANERFCQITGYSKDEIIGQSTRMFYESDETFNWVGEQRKKPLDSGKLFEIETQFKRKDGEIIDVYIRSRPMDEFGGQDEVVFTVQDITEQKEDIRALRESEEKFSLVFLNSPFAITITDYESGQITDINPAFSEILGYARDEVMGKTMVDLQIWKEIDDRKLVLDLLDQGHRVISQEYEFVRKNDEIIYGLYSADFIQLKGKKFILSTIDNITERKRRELELQVVANISEAMRSATSQADLQAILIENLIHHLDLDGVTLEQIDHSSGERKVICGGGIWESLEGNVIPAKKGVGSEVIASGSSQLIEDVNEDKRFFNSDVFQGLQSAACIPMKVQEQVIGLFWVGSRRKLEEMDLRLMNSIADMAANAIHRESLKEQTLHRLDELNTLRSIDLAINSSQDLGITLDMIASQLKNLIAADAIAILIYHPALLTLNFAAGAGFKTEGIKKSNLKLGEGVPGRVALEREPLWIEDISKSGEENVRKKLLKDEGFAAYHAVPLLVKGEIKGVVEVFHYKPFSADDEWKSTLVTVATQTAIAIDNSEMFQGLKKLNIELILAYDETLEGWAAALELRDHDTEGHSRRVTEHTLTMARAAGMSPEELTHVRRGALLHDIGKIGVPDRILQKAGPLDDNEWIIMREHPRIAYHLLSKVKYLKPALDIPYCHHEHWDGSGYPRGLKGEEIPLAARLFSVADVYDALTSDRPYRDAWTRAHTLKYIKEQAGKLLDPQAVKLFLKTLDY